MTPRLQIQNCIKTVSHLPRETYFNMEKPHFEILKFRIPILKSGYLLQSNERYFS